VLRAGSIRSAALASNIQLFISYRRDDAAGYAGRLYDDLAEAFGAQRIFFDVNTIELGQDFGVAIKDAIDRSTAVLVLIGPAWLATTAAGTRRIDDPNDLVRLEITTAIEAGKLLIPVLLGGAPMPPKASLPEPIAPLSRRQAIAVTHARWRADVDLLIDELAQLHRRTTSVSSAVADHTSIDSLIGRDDDLAILMEELERSRLITLTGPGGSGKTRLAQAATAALPGLGREAVFVDLAAIEDSSLVGLTIMMALRIEGPAARDPLDVVSDILRGRDTVLVLDNVEQIKGIQQPITDLIRATDGLRILATSRMPIGVRGEFELQVQMLGLPADRSIEAVEASPAGALFLARSRALGRLRSIDDSTAADISDLLQRLDGLPLGIELAAARTRALSPGEIVKRLEREGPDSIDRGHGDRHRSLRTILEWTLGLLSPDHRRLLEAVSICAGFDVDLAQALVEDQDVDALDGVESLVALGLVSSSGIVDGVSRFRLLETTRAMVVRRLTDDHVAILRDRHAAWFLKLSAEWYRASTGGWTPDLIERLDADADNIRRALDRMDAADPRGALALERNLEAFWLTRGRLAEGLKRVRRTMELAPEPSVELARALGTELTLAQSVSNDEEQHVRGERRIEIARTVGDRSSLLESLGHWLENEGDPAAAILAAAELDTIDPAELDARDRIQLFYAKAAASVAIHGVAGDEAVAALRALHSEASTDGRPGWLANAGCNLSQALLARGEHAEAEALAGAATRAFRDLDRQADLSWALGVRAAALAELGRTSEAVEAIVASAEIAQALQLDGTVSDALRMAMPVALAGGQPLLAAELWGSVLGMSEGGRYTPEILDRQFADTVLVRIRAVAPPEAVEIAIDRGKAMDPISFLGALPDQLKGIGTDTRQGGAVNE
jgi:predicted ATPase